MKEKFKNILSKINSNAQLRSGIILLLCLLSVAMLAPLIATHDPYGLYEKILAKPGEGGHILGTDGLGRDVFSQIVWGGRTSIKIGVIAAGISAIVGTCIGGVAGYFGGKVDRFITEFMNIFLMTPSFFLILIIIALFGSSILNMMIVIGLTSWTSNAKLMRAQAISIKQRTFIKSCQAMGESKASIMFKHIIPNGIFPIIANTTMNVSSAILTEAGLSFLGLGDPNVVSWGQIIYHGKGYLPSGWWISIFAGCAAVITVLTFFLIGDGLNRVLNPKMHGK
ncbi:ABC transporter permease [Clostridium polynesiense]|uniref:ABC transporter permease n=1 Tax=Clostridium polynesiense TaxID=1325933 RepID=UPI000590BA2D|nr:ABC transporter permease [Clostridium polynesiense]